jgi:hypothetical protein
VFFDKASILTTFCIRNLSIIGKAGGNTLRVLFKAYCESNRHKIDKECNNAPDSMLSDQVKGFFHSNFMIPKDGAPEAADAFLFNLRQSIA